MDILNLKRLKKLQRLGAYSKGILIDKDIQDDIKADHFNVSYDKETKIITIEPVYGEFADLD